MGNNYRKKPKLCHKMVIYMDMYIYYSILAYTSMQLVVTYICFATIAGLGTWFDNGLQLSTVQRGMLSNVSLKPKHRMPRENLLRNHYKIFQVSGKRNHMWVVNQVIYRLAPKCTTRRKINNVNDITGLIHSIKTAIKSI